MVKVIMLFVLALILAVLTGCSHNVSTYSDGLGFETTFRPDSGNFGIVLRYGKIWSFVMRENAEAEMTGSNEFDAEGNPVTGKTAGNVKIKVGAQTTGYDKDIVELLKGDPAAIAAFYEGKSRMIQASNTIKKESTE